ncbi:hypothetical protein ABRZ24_17530 [Brenneria populi]|uniref:Type VI secretion system tip protein VgrG n=1 Tax=Brenneria populi TaxID=1505588 RepID=A0ABU6JV42_9GAMM|nr:hypothetical protein [Brenneria populi Li et al. 2015]
MEHHFSTSAPFPSLSTTHNRYALTVNGRSDLDVASFSATEGLSQTYCYQITFTSRSDIAPAQMLLQDATRCGKDRPPPNWRR